MSLRMSLEVSHVQTLLLLNQIKQHLQIGDQIKNNNYNISPKHLIKWNVPYLAV